ncbi:MAG: hypothetical protein N2234_10580, partial [Planctomycetota bacterium]|nr:hypothetical protein [Planctomycetota bacterium]
YKEPEPDFNIQEHRPMPNGERRHRHEGQEASNQIQNVEVKEGKYKDAFKEYSSAKKKAEKEKELEEIVKKAEEGLKAIEEAADAAIAEAEKLANEGNYADAYKLLKKVQEDFKGTETAKKAREKETELKEKEKKSSEEPKNPPGEK